jgi:hypothetical protein
MDIQIQASASVPVVPDATIVRDLTFDPGAQIDLEGTLYVTGAIHVKYAIVPDKWYSIGFPYGTGNINVRSEWFESEGWSPLLPYKATGYGPLEEGGENYYGDYYLRAYNPASATPFSDVETIEAGKGYIILFPDYFVDADGNGGNIITFTSEPQTLTGGNNPLPVDDKLRLVPNPSFKNIELTPPADKVYYYLNKEENEYIKLTTDPGTLAPFEAAITGLSDQPETEALTIPIEEGPITGGGNRPAITSGPVLSTRYYTLQGIEVAQPAKSGVYIAKHRYHSGKEKIEKIIYKQQ